MRTAALVVALVACLHAAAWGLRQTQTSAPNFDGTLNSVSYSPFTTSTHPDADGSRPPVDRIRADLRAIAPYTRAIRLYSSIDGVDEQGRLETTSAVPRIAAEFDLKVSLGIWLDKAGMLANPKVKKEDRACRSEFEKEMRDLVSKAEDCSSKNLQEVRSALELLRRNHNVNALMVGNETLYRRDFTAKELTEIVKKVKEKVAGRVPVSTGEIYSEFCYSCGKRSGAGTAGQAAAAAPGPSGDAAWASWFGRLTGTEAEEDPEQRSQAAEKLISNLDFIAVHVLPYWGGTSPDAAVNQALNVYSDLRARFKGKHVMIAEFGWPSSGYNRRDAVPGHFEQAEIMRGFVARASALGVDYNLIEAYDQPWKTIEGSVGAYWGLFDNATREAKFGWTGAVTDADTWQTAAIAIAIGILISLPVLGIAGATLGQTLLLVFAAHVIGAWAAILFEYWATHYFVFGAAFALGLGTVLLIPLAIIALGRIGDIAGIVFGTAPERLLRPRERSASSGGQALSDYAPKVSIHVPAYREPPEMLKATLDAVSRLDYPNFECIVIINNTPDPAMWQPVAEHCRTLGERFKFLNIDKLQGFKAGALRVAMAHTAPDAEIIGIIDADYAVKEDWLSALVPTFADPKVGLVQAPQDHRDGSRSPLHEVMNGEYAGFFDIGMVERNEHNAIIVHGTMCLIRRVAMEQAGGWSSDTICEDTDLGLSIIELGWQSHYTNRRYGWGLLPDTFEAFKKQRDRWAAGGFQIVKKHWRRFLPGASALSADQKREFAFGWVNWLGAESVGVLCAILNLVWVPVVAFLGIAVPDKVLTLPIMVTFAISVIHFVALYHRRVAIPMWVAGGAMVAAMAMQWTVARAVAGGLISEHLTFVRTAKGGGSRRRRTFPAFEEAVIGGLLLLGAAIVFARNGERVREINLFGIVLVVQSLPFLAATVLAAFENSRLNDFAYLNSAKERLLDAVAPVVPMVRRRPAARPVTPE